jgi:hypothetical protein
MAAGVLLLVHYVNSGRSPSPDPIPPQGVSATDAQDATPHPQSTASNAGEEGQPVAVTRGKRRKEPGSLVAAEDLIARLSKVNVTNGSLSRENAQLLNETFQQLVAQGTAGIPAIRAFLERQEDLNFSKLEGGDLANYRSLRIGLFDVLKQVGGPDAMDVSLQALQATGDPWEIAVLSRNLEQLAPGQFTQQALSSASASLSRALSSGAAGQDVAPLFQVLQSYGNAGVVAQLEQAFPRWSYYSAITLANLPEGEGIPALVRQAQDPSGQANGQSEVALRMLAQVAADNPQASEALLALARQNQISGQAWASIASGLAGYNLELGTPLVDKVMASPGASGLQAFRVDQGAQDLFSTPLSASWLDEQIGSRLSIIDQLVTANPTGAAVEDLLQARASLTNMVTTLDTVPR